MSEDNTGQAVISAVGGAIGLLMATVAWLVLTLVWFIFLAIQIFSDVNWDWWYIGGPGIFLAFYLIILVLNWRK